MLKLNIQNFRNIRSLDLTDEGKLSIFVGYNESGKSSLAGAIKFAFCGEAFGHKGKSVGALVTHGESRMSVRVQVNDMLVYRTSYDTGDSLTEIAKNLNTPKDVVPLLFDSQMAGDGGNKAMRSYLTGVSEDLFDPAVHFAADDVIKNCVELAKRAGKLQVKGIVTYCEDQRAQNKAPSKPQQPQKARPTATQLEQAKANLATAIADVDRLTSELKEATTISQDVSRVANYVRAVEDYQAKMKTQTGDTLGAQREVLERLSAVNTKTLDAMADLLAQTPYTVELELCRTLQTQLAIIVSQSAATLAKNPKPASAPSQPVEPECFGAYRNSFEASGQTVQSCIPGVLAQAAQAVQRLTDARLSAITSKDLAQAVHDDLQRLTGAWESYDAINLAHASKAQKIEVEWAKWNRAAKEIAAAHTAFLTQQSQRFSNIITDMGAAVLGGRKLAIDITNGITLGGFPITDVSLSTRWRMEVSVMTAVARSLNSPLLIIDGADILDARNRKIMTQFLLDHVVPHFKHVVLTMTAKDDISAETPVTNGSATRWIINDGSAHKLV